MSQRIIRFGAFELDAANSQLRKSGVRLKLQEQPLQVLAALLERPGELVSREELKERLWAGDTFVDFDRGLNTAVNKIRETLGDSASSPRFVETIPRRGYRFVGPLQVEHGGGTAPGSKSLSRGRRLVLAATTTVVAAAVIVGWGAWNSSSVEAPSVAEPVPFTTYPGVERSPSFSPDGRQVAFARQESPATSFNIWVQDVSQPNARPLTADPSHDQSPAWSPDGKTIAFLRHRAEGIADLMTVSPQGGPQSLVASVHSDAGGPSRLSWSPDGLWLAIDQHGGEDGSEGLFLIAAASGKQRQLVRDKYVRAPAFSPDGSMIAFFSRGHMDPNVAVIDLKDETVRIAARIVEGAPAGLTWTKGGRILAAAGERLWTISTEGGEPQGLGFAGRGIREPTYSLSTGRLMFARQVKDGRIWRFDTETPHATPELLVPSTFSNRSPQLSPDGRRLLFTSNRSGQEAVWVADADGNNTLQLTDEPIGGSPRWSPDGSLIAFDAPGESALATFVVRSSGGPLRRLTRSSHYDGTPSFSHDGRWVYFASLRSGEMQIWKTSVEGESAASPAIQITQGGGYAPLESHDGQYVYYVKAHGPAEAAYANSIWRVGVEGGKEETVIETLYSNWGNWALSREALFYVSYEAEQSSGGEPRQWAVYRCDLQGRPTRKVLDVPGEPILAAPGFDVSADGRSILYASRTEQADLFLVEGLE